MPRKIYNMDANWRFHPGEIDEARENTHRSSYDISKAGGLRGVRGRYCHDADWRTVQLPHDYLSEAKFGPKNLLSHGYRQRSNAWYRKSFPIGDDLRDKQLLLCFEGTAVNAEFFFNGSIMARSFSAYMETAFDISDRVSFGKNRMNTLAVHINGMETEGWWYEGAGIYRHVRLYVKSLVHIAHNGIFAKPVLIDEKSNSWRVDLRVELENSGSKASSATLVATLRDRDGAAVAKCAKKGNSRNSFTSEPAWMRLDVRNPRRWDVDSPDLYTLTVEVVQDGEAVDSDSARIGFRTIAVDADRGFLLNGRVLKIKGTCNHQDHAGVGTAIPDSIQRYRIELLKSMGSNAYRCSHNLPAKEVLDACDELGLVVMDENRRFESREEVLQYLDQMVRRDANHPSVCFWSLFNEEPLQNTEEGVRIYRRMRARIERFDDSRLFTGAINGSMEGAGLEMDVTGINYFSGDFDDMHSRHPGQPMIGSENNSAFYTRGCYESDREKAHVLADNDEERSLWGQTARQTWKAVRDRGYFSGIFIWTGFDYRGEPSPFQWPSVSSQFGLLDTCGFKKEAFHFVRACFSKSPVVHIATHWNWRSGQRVKVSTPTNCEEVQLLLNGEVIGRKSGDACETPAWTVPFKPGVLEARGFVKGKLVATDRRATAGKAASIRIEASRAILKNDGHDAVALNFSLADKDGNTLPAADDMLRFTVRGPAIIRGVGNGDPNSHEPDSASRRKLFAGRCQAIVMSKYRPSGAKGLKVVVTAHAEGLPKASLEIDVAEAPDPNFIPSYFSGNLGGFTMSKVTATRPNPLHVIADSDMNSFTPVTFDDTHQTDIRNGYRIYRCKFNTRRRGDCSLQFHNIIASQLEIYVDGKLKLKRSTPIARTEPGGGAKFVCPIGEIANGGHELRVMIRMGDAPWGGIREGVKVIADEPPAKAK